MEIQAEVLNAQDYLLKWGTVTVLYYRFCQSQAQVLDLRLDYFAMQDAGYAFVVGAGRGELDTNSQCEL